METVNALYPWSQETDIRAKMKVVAISLDETETEIKDWKKKLRELTGWTNLHAEEGVRSKVAGDYYVLATPVMVLLDSKTQIIIALPNTLEEVKAAIQK